MSERDYSDEQVEAALTVWLAADNTTREDVAPAWNTLVRDMRAALAAASVPAQPVLTPAQRAEGWVIRDQGGMLVKTAPLVLPPAEPQPDAPLDIAQLPDYWDERRRRQGKPDLSRCAAELRNAHELERARAVWHGARAKELRDSILTRGLYETQVPALDELVRLAGGDHG